MPIRPYDTSTAAETAAHNGADDMTPEPLADRIQKLTNSTTRTNGMTIEPGFSETGFFVHTATVSAVFHVRSDVALAARSSDRAAADAAWDVIKAAAAAKIESLNN